MKPMLITITFSVPADTVAQWMDGQPEGTIRRVVEDHIRAVVREDMGLPPLVVEAPRLPVVPPVTAPPMQASFNVEDL